MRPSAVEHEAGGVELEHQGQVAEVAGLQRHAFRAHRHPGVAGVVAADPHPELEGLDVGAVGGRLPDDEAERHQQVSGVAVEGVRAARALADVPGVHGVVDELGDRVEERRQRAHVLVRHEEATPRVGVEALDEGEHLGPVLVEPRQQLVLRGASERQRALVHVPVHAPHAERIRGGAAGPRHVDAVEVALGGVDEVADDVAHLPVARGRRCLPRRRRRCQRQHLVRVLADRSQQVVLAGEVAELPLAHVGPPPTRANRMVRRSGGPGERVRRCWRGA